MSAHQYQIKADYNPDYDYGFVDKSLPFKSAANDSDDWFGNSFLFLAAAIAIAIGSLFVARERLAEIFIIEPAVKVLGAALGIVA